MCRFFCVVPRKNSFQQRESCGTNERSLYCIHMKTEQTYQNLLHGFYRKHKRMPSYAEAAVLFGLQSKDSAYRVMGKLIDRGIVEKDTSGKLIPTGSLLSPLRVLGLVEAGFPTPAEEDILDTISLDEWLINDREATFMLQVKGDSMKDAAINEGDMVIVERTEHPKVGQIVIAEVDGSWTMKYLAKDEQGLYLNPANDAYPIIRPHEELRIAAVVRAVVRKYD